MKIKGSKDELVELLKLSYASKGTILTDVKIASGGNWSGIAREAPNTIGNLLEKMYPLYTKKAISDLKRNLTRYFSNLPENTKRAGEPHYGFAYKRASEIMTSGDVQLLKSVEGKDYLVIHGAGRYSWDLLQDIIESHL